VEHRKEDGFKYLPKKPVDWMVCDMVEQPARISQLILKWALGNYAKEFIFNLKLPMKKRYQETQKNIEYIRTELFKNGKNYVFSCKQLYHDREEVTCYLRIM
jgi:23S rRNA (cytidine2498-2'-O)-methyltransferase